MDRTKNIYKTDKIPEIEHTKLSKKEKFARKKIYETLKKSYETFDSKKVLFQELKDHDNTIIKEWAEEGLKTHLSKMKKIRDLQKNESKSRFERFE